MQSRMRRGGSRRAAGGRREAAAILRAALFIRFSRGVRSFLAQRGVAAAAAATAR